MSSTLLRPCVPMIHVAAKWTHAFNQDRFLVQLFLQKMSGQGVRTHPPMVLSAMSREIKQLVFFQVQQAYLPPCVKVLIYSVRSSASLFNDGKTFWLVMMPLGGGRVIITLQTAVKDHGRLLAIIPVLLLYRRQNVGCGRLSE